MWPVHDLKSFLGGCWHFRRSLLDRRNATTGSVTGSASFEDEPNGLVYKEVGTVLFGAHHGPTEQVLRFEFRNGGRQALVRLRDGRAFHDLDLSDGAAEVTHLCEPDLYRGSFAALSADEWRSSWTVAGPRKDQEIVTLYTRRS